MTIQESYMLAYNDLEMYDLVGFITYTQKHSNRYWAGCCYNLGPMLGLTRRMS